jgi:hypothetical protein
LTFVLALINRSNNILLKGNKQSFDFLFQGLREAEKVQRLIKVVDDGVKCSVPDLKIGEGCLKVNSLLIAGTSGDLNGELLEVCLLLLNVNGGK